MGKINVSFSNYNKNMKMKTVKLLAIAFLLPLISFSQNPIIQTIYTADPAPMVHNDTVYLYTTHDEDTIDYAIALYGTNSPDKKCK